MFSLMPMSSFCCNSGNTHPRRPKPTLVSTLCRLRQSQPRIRVRSFSKTLTGEITTYWPPRLAFSRSDVAFRARSKPIYTRYRPTHNHQDLSGSPFFTWWVTRSRGRIHVLGIGSWSLTDGMRFANIAPVGCIDSNPCSVGL